jgi:Phage tail protein
MPVDVDWEFEYNGLILNDYSTNPPTFPLRRVEGLDTPDVRFEEIDKAMEHGSFTFGQFYKPRRVVLEGDILASTSAAMESAVDTLKEAFAAQEEDLPLRVQRPGVGIRRLNCKPSRGPAFPIDPQYAIGNGVFAVELTAADPLFYADELDGFDSLTDDGIGQVVNNEGNMPTFPEQLVFRPTDNITTMEARNARNVLYTLSVEGVFDSFDMIVLDFQKKKITDGVGGPTIYDVLDLAASRWWPILPGNNTIHAEGADFELDMVFRSAWL